MTNDALKPVTHMEAHEAAQRLINSHFRQEPHARVSIPARPDYDDDLRIMRYIEEQEARAHPQADAPAPVSPAPAEKEAVGGFAAHQITMGTGNVDVGPIEWEGKRGLLFRPRSDFIPVGEPGELQDEPYWPTADDVVIWLQESSPAVITKALGEVFPSQAAEARVSVPEEKCPHCRGDGHFYQLRQGNPFEMSIFEIADRSVRIECPYCRPQGASVSVPEGWATIDSVPQDGTHIQVGWFDGGAGFGMFNGVTVPMQTVAHWFGPADASGLRAGGLYPSVQTSDGNEKLHPTHWKHLDSGAGE